MASGRPSYLMEGESFLLPISEALDNEQSRPIFFQFLPKVTGDSEGANFESTGDVMGRAEQFSIYKSGKPKSLSITANFAAVDETHDRYWVQRQANRLKALTKPVYDRENIFLTGTSKYFGPPLVIFTYGYKYINMPVVVTQVDTENHDSAHIDPINLLPNAINVTISIQTNYPYGFVPGYINYIELFPDDPTTRLDPKQMSFGGNVAELVPADVQEILVDSAAPKPQVIDQTSGIILEDG